MNLNSSHFFMESSSFFDGDDGMSAGNFLSISIHTTT